MLSALVCGIVYNAIHSRELSAIKDRAVLASDLLNSGRGYDEFTDYANYDTDAARVTIIGADGAVLLDNKADAATLENHGDREEFRQALQTGRGEATRYSRTLGAETYYYAIRLADGNVLRVSKTTGHILGVFTAMLPPIAGVTAVVMLLALILARRLTKNIVGPLNSIDFDGDSAHNVYDELLPFVKKIDQQKTEIANQIVLLKNRAYTIDHRQHERGAYTD
jgi:two-component system phosphate regulon sensor histidine kinase PhoR